jgi:ParB-like chromosome segregation protein Spo0J
MVNWIKKFFLKRSIKKHGVKHAILIAQDGTVIDGGHRLQVAKELDIELPVVIVKSSAVMKNANQITTE